MTGPMFYPGKVHGRINGRTFQPDIVDGRVMVNPHYGNLRDCGAPYLPALVAGTLAVCDSGAFQERDMLNRKTPDEAIDRQKKLRDRLRRDGCGADFDFEAVVTYDLLVDEALVDGKRVKRRASEEAGIIAVRETVAAARAYHARRDEFAGAIAYSCQGATLRQYMACARVMLDLARPGKDWIALGGFCIIGMMPSLKPLFVAVCREIAPLMKACGIHRAHVLGVCVCDALIEAAAIFAENGIEFATDSTSMEQNAILGKLWDEGHADITPKGSSFVKLYGKADKNINYHSADLAMVNTRNFSRWFAKQGRDSKPRRPVPAMQEGLCWGLQTGA